ncbi:MULTISPECIES: helix-turn-helix domain-containing protein [Tomitella]|uniref:XRE family transcriptional regulator n=1 Tax=Tomitella cavernea TaxID=1387982 RepID=A0ABP9CCM2_9ACTN|nr:MULTISPECIES: XRE family transcriptional regulator [Tomitella]
MSHNDIIETASVWDAISDTPEESANRRLRSELMTAIRGQIDRFGWSQTVAAQNLGVTQPRLSDLYRGKLSKFSLNALVDLGGKVGVHVSVRIDTDALTRS